MPKSNNIFQIRGDDEKRLLWKIRCASYDNGYKSIGGEQDEGTRIMAKTLCFSKGNCCVCNRHVACITHYLVDEYVRYHNYEETIGGFQSFERGLFYRTT
ncbi:hypothetical protein PAT3040_04191 [Paenibacillus agaridevorans]|uniref:Uncharacterized protein n=1 Tax=Paenibacillus agaridevorans TaxID=171404 RepID=A0A2R5EV46_9BACL|nr:hypothetical protein PAT3040_04191 [Paenibacillus agaridevorans]